MSSIKRWALGALWRMDSVLPRGLAIWTKNRCWPWHPVLDVVEIHLADTCNLNCRNCLHFSPFCKPKFASLADVERDFTALQKKFVSIRHVHLLGGEPLLHPDCVAFLRLTRRMWPATRLSLVTNGLLLSRQPEAFWTACRELNVLIDMTWYPIMTKDEMETIRRKCEAGHVVLRVTPVTQFINKIRLEGRENAARSFAVCRLSQFCPYLRDGRLYPCATSYHLADRMQDVVREPGIEIREHSAGEILRYLLTPVGACRYCAAEPVAEEWKKEGE